MKGICLVPYIHMWNYINNYNWNIYEHKNGRTLPRNKIKQYTAPLVFFSHVIIRYNQRGLNTKRPTVVFFLGPTKPLRSYCKANPHPRHSVSKE